MINNREVNKKMVSYKKVLDSVAEVEHNQWMFWSKSVSEELKKAIVLGRTNKIDECCEMLANILRRWEKNWKPFSELSNDSKDDDRIWAEQVFSLMPNKCSLIECGGPVVHIDRQTPEYFTGWQSPDLVCSKCGGIYQFKGFKKQKKIR